MNDKARQTQQELEQIRTAALLAGASPEAAQSAVEARIRQLLPPHMQALPQTNWNNPAERAASAQRWRDEHARAAIARNLHDEQQRTTNAVDDSSDDSAARAGVRSFVKQCF